MNDRGSEPSGPSEDKTLSSWAWRGVSLLAGLVIVFVAYKAGASFLPRWWAQFVGGQVGGSFGNGIAWGLFYGIFFTFLPLALALQTRRRWFGWKGKTVVLVIAVLLASPNWLSLFVAVSDRPSAVAAWQTFNVQAPTFLWSSAIGALIGGAAAVAMSAVNVWLRHRRRQIDELRRQVRENGVRENGQRAADESADG